MIGLGSDKKENITSGFLLIASGETPFVAAFDLASGRSGLDSDVCFIWHSCFENVALTFGQNVALILKKKKVLYLLVY